MERWFCYENRRYSGSCSKRKNIGKEFENKASVKSSLFGSLVALFVGILLFMLEYFIKDSVNVGLIAVGMAASGAQSLFEGIKVKKTYLIIVGIVQLLIALFAILAFISKLVTK